MGLSDIPPPTAILCLKRCRSEDPSSLTDLCAPLPKQPSPPPPPPPPPLTICNHTSHHLSLLADLESSLDAPPVEAPSPEELVMEMMKSLEKVMGDIGELVSVSGQVTPDTIADSPRMRYLTRDIASDYAAARELVAPSIPTARRVGTTTTVANSLLMVDDMISVECDFSSELDPYARDGSDACGAGRRDVDDLCPWDERYVEERSLEDGFRDGGHVRLDDMQRLLDMSDDDLCISVAEAMTHASEQWTLLDDFTSVDGCDNGLINGGAVFLEEGYEFPSFALSQDEEGSKGARDCYL